MRRQHEQKPDPRYDPKQFRRPRTGNNAPSPRSMPRIFVLLAWACVVALLYGVFTMAGHVGMSG